MSASVLELSQEVFERLEAYRQRCGLSRDAALLELLEQADASDWLEARLVNVPVDDEELTSEEHRLIDEGRRSLERGEGMTLEEFTQSR